MATPKPVRMSIEEVLNALSWHISAAYPAMAETPHRQIWSMEGVTLIPITPEKTVKMSVSTEGREPAA